MIRLTDRKSGLVAHPATALAQAIAAALNVDGVEATLPSTQRRADIAERDSVALVVVDQRTFSVTAVPKGIQTTADTACATLSSSQMGAKTASGTGTVATCWR